MPALPPLILASLLVTGVLATTYTPAHSFDLSDPTGAKALSASIDRTSNQLRQLEGTADRHVQERLEQLRSIVQDANSGVQALIDKATAAVTKLEEQVNKDALEFVYRVRCLSPQFNEDIKRTFVTMINDVHKTDPNITLLGIVPFIQFNTTPVPILNYHDAYHSTKDGIIKYLDTNVKDDTPAEILFSKYDELGDAARSMACHNLDKPSAIVWIQEVNDVDLLILPYTKISSPRHHPKNQ